MNIIDGKDQTRQSKGVPAKVDGITYISENIHS